MEDKVSAKEPELNDLQERLKVKEQELNDLQERLKVEEQGLQDRNKALDDEEDRLFIQADAQLKKEDEFKQKTDTFNEKLRVLRHKEEMLKRREVQGEGPQESLSGADRSGAESGVKAAPPQLTQPTAKVKQQGLKAPLAPKRPQGPSPNETVKSEGAEDQRDW